MINMSIVVKYSVGAWISSKFEVNQFVSDFIAKSKLPNLFQVKN